MDGAHRARSAPDVTEAARRLGLDPATLDGPGLRRAFARAALCTHPDRGGDPRAFAEVLEAYRLLGEHLGRHHRRGPRWPVIGAPPPPTFTVGGRPPVRPVRSRGAVGRDTPPFAAVLAAAMRAA